ncbi:MAG: helix-turn-helix transcriptional regulator [Gemmataceae bacterium]
MSETTSEYLTIDEAAAYCRLAKGTLYNRRAEIRKMPGTRKLLFKREDLDAWLERRQPRKFKH